MIFQLAEALAKDFKKQCLKDLIQNPPNNPADMFGYGQKGILFFNAGQNVATHSPLCFVIPDLYNQDSFFFFQDS